MAGGAGLRSCGPIQQLRAPHGSWQGDYCTLFITMEDEQVMESNMQKMWNDRRNPTLTVGDQDSKISHVSNV